MLLLIEPFGVFELHAGGESGKVTHFKLQPHSGTRPLVKEGNDGKWEEVDPKKFYFRGEEECFLKDDEGEEFSMHNLLKKK